MDRVKATQLILDRQANEVTHMQWLSGRRLALALLLHGKVASKFSSMLPVPTSVETTKTNWTMMINWMRERQRRNANMVMMKRSAFALAIALLRLPSVRQGVGTARRIR